MYHEICLGLLDGALYKAPLCVSPQRILDVGTGTGIWAIDMADRFPGAEVFGTDLTPIQPAWVPANCRFQIDDAEKEWTFAPEYFDFVHARNVAQGIGDWPRLMAQIFRYRQLRECSVEACVDLLGVRNQAGIASWSRWAPRVIRMMGR
jgi:SAM-dependent methyltransferase